MSGSRLACAALAVFPPATALAQRTDDNAVTSAEDAFGVSVGAESIGLYDSREVRGFSPEDAGNMRIEGLYASIEGNPNSSLQTGNTIRVGMATLGYPFPAPTGIVDYRLLIPDGKATLSTVFEQRSFGGFGFEAEAQMPLVDDRLGIAAGTTVKNVVDNPGQDFFFFNFAVIPRWRPSAKIEVIPFYSWSWRVEDSKPTIFTAGSKLPPPVSKETFVQPWADLERETEAYGAITRVDGPSGVALRAGLFHSKWQLTRSHTDFYRNTDSTGLADHSVVANPAQRRVGWSGEARISKAWTGKRSAHTIHAMVRGRTSANRYGGSDSIALGKARIGELILLPEPQFDYGPQKHERVTQLAAGIGYEGRWRTLGEINLGLQRARYKRKSNDPSGTPDQITSESWLYNGLVAVNLTRRLAAYASYTKGIEENGTAPDAAANRGEPLPAVITSQREAGLRFMPLPHMTLIAGVFDIRKPYYNLDASNVFARLGTLRNRGVEISLAGSVATGLNVVVGAALMDPTVSGEAVATGITGKFPAARTRNLLRLDVDYRLPFWRAASVDATIQHWGSIAASVRNDPATGKQLFNPSRTELSVGGRYRLKLRGAASVLRLQLENVTDERGWDITPSGGFRVHAPRRFTARLTLDM